MVVRPFHKVITEHVILLSLHLVLSESIAFKKYFIHLILERGKVREKEWERNIDVPEIHGWAASHTPSAGDLACNPGMCPDWE